MSSLFTLPADSFSLPNGSSSRLAPATHSLAGNILWAMGHLAETRSHSLFYFHGIKGGSLRWHQFAAPQESADQVQLELGAEGGLGLRMDDNLFLGTVESVSEARISWSKASGGCLDFQLGNDRVCFRENGSRTLSLISCDLQTTSKSLPSPPDPPDCYCLSPHDDVIVVSALSVLVLAPPYSHWARIQTSPQPRAFLSSLFVSREPRFNRLCIAGQHFCALSKDGQTLSLLPLVPSPAWEHFSLDTAAREICPIGTPAQTLSFLLLDRHFSLFTASLESHSVRARDQSHSLPPDSEMLFSSIRSLRPLFECRSELDTLLSPPSPSASSPSVSSPSQLDDFFTAAQSEIQPMELEISPRSSQLISPFHTPTPSAAVPSPLLIPPSADLPSQQLVSTSPIDSSSQQLISTPSADLNSHQLIYTPSVDLSSQKLISTPSADLPSQQLIPPTADLPTQHQIPPTADLPSQQLIAPSNDLHSQHQIPPTADLPTQQQITPTADLPSHQLIPPTAPIIDWSESERFQYNPAFSDISSAERIIVSIPSAESLFSSNSQLISDRPSAEAEVEKLSVSESPFLVEDRMEPPVTGHKRAMPQHSHSSNKLHKFDTDSLSNSHKSAVSNTDTFGISSLSRHLTDPVPAPFGIRHLHDQLIRGRTSEERRTDKRLLRELASPCPLPPTAFFRVIQDFSHFHSLLQEAKSCGDARDPLPDTEQLLFEEERFDSRLAKDVAEDLGQIYPSLDSPLSIPSALATPHNDLFEL